MSLKAILTTAVLIGSSSAALAHPTSQARWNRRTVVRDHRDDDWRADELRASRVVPVRRRQPVVSGSWGFGYDADDAPSYVTGYDESDYPPPQPIYQPPQPPQPVDQPSWVNLRTVDYQFDTSYQGPLVIDVGNRPVTLFRVTGEGAFAEIYDFKVHYADGTTTTASWNHVLGAQGTAALPDTHFAGRIISSIEVTGISAPNTRLTFQVL